MYTVVWSFDVRLPRMKAFERAYGPNGDWVRLFRRAAGYVGTELRRETDRAAHFVTIDRWNTREDYDRFMVAFQAEYDRLDVHCATMTEREQKIGDFETTGHTTKQTTEELAG